MGKETFRKFREFYARGDYQNALIEYGRLKSVSLELAGALAYEYNKIRHNLDYVVSLTTWPGRIHLCHKAVESILLQEERPKKVVLWLGREEFPEGEACLPLALTNLQSDIFSIEWCDNVYSFNKLIPSLLRYPEKIIITADDDVIYPKNWLERLLNAHMEDPLAAFGHRVRRIVFKKNGEIAPYLEWERYKGAGAPGDYYFITGVAGALYPPGVFHPDILDSHLFLRLCRHGDDIWFWAMLLRAGTRIRPLADGTKWQPVKTIEGSQTTKLWEENQSGRNDSMLKALLEHYPDLACLLGARPGGSVMPTAFQAEETDTQKINVSVIMPVYNTAAYLEKCIERILINKGIRLELIIIDDGSTDNSAEIIDRYQKKDSRVLVVKKTNAGQGIARNIGMKLATGEYIYFMDSDDYLDNNALTELYHVAKTKNLDLCSPHIPLHYFEKPLECVCCIPTRGQFIRADIVRKYDITQPDARSGQDGVFSLLYFCHCNRIAVAKNVRCVKNQRDDSTFEIYSKSNHDAVVSILRSHYSHILEHFDKYNLWTSNAHRLLQFILNESIRNRIAPHFKYLSSDDRTQCFALLKMAVEKCAKTLKISFYEPALHPLIQDLLKTDPAEMATVYAQKYHGNEICQILSTGRNYQDGSLYVCINEYPENDISSIGAAKEKLPVQKAKTAPDRSSAIEHKLDYLLQTINNNLIKTFSAMCNPVPSLEDGDQSIIVSLTTLPGRLETVHHVIESIFRQDHKPGKIVLWLGEAMQAMPLPQPLLAQTQRGLAIEYITDVGPHIKLLYALQKYPRHNIVTVDDDIVYPANMLGALQKWHKRFPHAVVANWARQLAFDPDGKVKPVRTGKLLNTHAENNIEPEIRADPAPDLLGLPYGTAGVLYPPGALNEKVFDIDLFRRVCPTEDDIWFRAMGILNGTPVVVTDLGMRPVHFGIPGSQTEALRYINHEEQKNHAQLLAVFEELGLYEVIGLYTNLARQEQR